tara:strand:+ start:227 stop:403 length:177 start_codon:yes stop_codon:yes gene_type:complete
MGATLSNLALISHYISQYKSPKISNCNNEYLTHDNRKPLLSGVARKNEFVVKDIHKYK